MGKKSTHHVMTWKQEGLHGFHLSVCAPNPQKFLESGDKFIFQQTKILKIIHQLEFGFNSKHMKDFNLVIYLIVILKNE